MSCKPLEPAAERWAELGWVGQADVSKKRVPEWMAAGALPPGGHQGKGPRYGAVGLIAQGFEETTKCDERRTAVR